MTALRIRFDGHEPHQLEAIQAVVDLFQGQPVQSGMSPLQMPDEADVLFQELGVANRLLITEEQLVANLRSVQRRHGLRDDLEYAGRNFSVEMETGTGKTYVYLRTAYELARRYGFTKFVVVAPSIAIREGIQKSIELTREHFADLFERMPSEAWVYDSAKLSRLRQFAASGELQFLVVNLDAFNKASNVIKSPQDSMSGRRPIEFIQACQPIVILDEPQNMESELSRQAIASLRPLATLRYSATHRNPYNLVYQLDPVRAYELGLVKRIEVDSVVDAASTDTPYVKVESVEAKGSRVSATLIVDAKSDAGQIRRSVRVNHIGADLGALTGRRDSYKGYVVARLDAARQSVEFANGVRIRVGEEQGTHPDAIKRAQIRETVQEHLDKELEVHRGLPEGRRVKVLSLFFIDRVARYVQPDGEIRRWFEEAYREFGARPEYSELDLPPLEEVHGGYFARSRGLPTDTDGSTSADDEAYALIMRDKERLLARSTPLRFIFSHSALREGWDNPNVFQICTLNETRSDMKKRQEIGRGMRLPVDESGERCRDSSVNRVTVIANESYEEFARQLQTEIETDFGVSFEGRILNRRERMSRSLKPGWREDERFQELWTRIRPRTRCKVSFDTSELVENAARAIASLPETVAPKIVVRKARLELGREGVVAMLESEGVERMVSERPPLPDVLTYLQEETGITRRTLALILAKSGRAGDLLIDPQSFLGRAAVAIDDALRCLMVAGVRYELTGEVFDASLFSLADTDCYSSRAVEVQKSITDRIEVDSEVERTFARGLDALRDVEFFLKLPRWYRIPTPIGGYNPDWAIVRDNGGRTFLIGETKGTTDPDELRPSEVAKFECGRAHFRSLGVDFAVITSVAEI